MALDVDDLITSSTPEQVQETLYATADTYGLTTTAWHKLSPLRSIFAIVAYLFSAFTVLQAVINRSGFLELATGRWLTLLAQFFYGVTRNAASFATDNVTIDNAGGGLYTYTPGELIVLNSATGKTFFNTALTTINPLQTGVIVAVQATEEGSDSTSAPGQINAFSSAAPGLSVTNASSLIGTDEEEDAPLRLRCTDSLAALSPNGAADAYRYVATTQTLNGGVNCTRVRVLPPPGDGTVTVVLAGPSGALTGGEVTTIDGKIQGSVVREIDTAIVQNAVNESVNHTVDVYISTAAGLDNATVEALAVNAITNYYPTLPIGGVLLQGGPSRGVPWRGVEGAVKAANAFIIEAKLSSETDTTLTDTKVAIPGTITAIAHQVAA